MVAHLIRCCTVLALGFAPLLGQAPSKTGPELKLNNVIPQVLVNIKISTSSESLFLPYCGEAERTPIRGVLGAHLQVHSPQGWRPAKLRKTFGVLGGMDLGRFGGRILLPRTDTNVVFTFSRRHFEVEAETAACHRGLVV